jgi:cell wall-associated NlpC family hydrolase
VVKAVAGGVGLAVAAVLGVVLLVVGITGSPGGAPSGKAERTIPAAYLSLYESAALSCPGLDWTVLAAVGTVESNNGQSTAPGVTSGANSAGAEGPMQFEPATFASYAFVGPGGAYPPSPYDPVDAVYSAARFLCANGAGNTDTVASALYAYNHSSAYVATVLSLAATLADPSGGAAAEVAVGFAESQLGVPYRWGGTGSGGFDCSGLVQAAYQAAGVPLPRVAQDQYDAGPQVAPGDPLQPGDLVFFGPSPAQVEHVGIYVGGGDMIDAPHTGAVVRVESAGWPDFVGATRPGG